MAEVNQGVSPADKPRKANLSDLRKCHVWEAVMNNAAFMLAPFNMPAYFAQTGWLVGLSFVIFSNVVTFSTGIIIGEICCAYPSLHSYPMMAEEAFRRIGMRLFNAGPPAQRRWAATGRTLVLAVQFITYYLAGIAELLYLEQYLSLLLPSVGICQPGWLAISALVCWPFMQIPSFHESRWAALVAVVLIMFSVVVDFYEIVLVSAWSSCVPGPEYTTPSIHTAMVGVSGIAYAYGGHGIFPEQIREMEEPKSWPQVMRWTYGIVTPIYVALGAAGYFSFGRAAHANINANFPMNVANQFSIAIAAAAELYYVYFSVLVCVLQVELWLGVDPNSWCERRVFEAETTNCTPSTATESLHSEGMDDPMVSPWNATSGGWEPTAIETHTGWREWLSLRRLGVTPFGFRLIFRSLFLGSMFLITRCFMAGNGAVMLAIQSLSGAIGFMALTYVLPLIMGWALLPQANNWYLAYQILAFAVSVPIFVVGIYFAMADLRDNIGSLNGEVSCQYYGYTYYSDDRGYGCGAALGLANASGFW